MTIDEEVKALADVCRLLLRRVESSDRDVYGFVQNDTNHAIEVVESIAQSGESDD